MDVKHTPAFGKLHSPLVSRQRVKSRKQEIKEYRSRKFCMGLMLKWKEPLFESINDELGKDQSSLVTCESNEMKMR